MMVCPDCRGEMPDPRSPCAHCDWAPGLGEGFIDYLATRDRKSAAAAELIETYDALAERDWSGSGQNTAYLEGLNQRFAEQLDDLSGKEVCDVGSDRGYFVKYALARGARVTALDITDVSLRRVSQMYNIPCYLANAENLPFHDAFDVLVGIGILELVPNMGNFLVTANWALRSGGTLAVRVANREKLFHYSNFHGLPVHFTQLRTFDRSLVVDLVEQAGFKVERVFFDGYVPSRTAPWLDRYPKLARRLRDRLVSRYGAHDASAAPLRRLLLSPIQIGVAARKVSQVVPGRLYQSFAAVIEERQQKREACAPAQTPATASAGRGYSRA